MSSIGRLVLSWGLLSAAATARAGDCDGDPGWVLKMPDHADVGSHVTICMQGPPDLMGLLMVSLGEGPVESVYGTICLDFPLLTKFLFDFDSAGSFCISADVPCDPAAVGLTVFAQFITCSPHRGISNQASLTITDGICAGDIATFNELAWGEDCDEGNAGCRLADAFDALFPEGLTVGDQTGTVDDFYALVFTSPAAIGSFLPPNDGEPEILSGDATDPETSSACDLAGQLAAARLNLAFDDAGLFDDLKARPDLKLGDLVFVANVHKDLLGFTVRDMIDICDLAISGALGEGDLDIDGDGDLDAYLPDLSDALREFNKNSEDGTINRGSLDAR